MRLIDIDTLKKDLKDNYIYFGETQLLDDFYKALNEQPTVQAVPIEVLDKIRVEIELKEKTLTDKYGQQKYGVWTDDVLQIIDKYKAESEDKE